MSTAPRSSGAAGPAYARPGRSAAATTATSKPPAGTSSTPEPAAGSAGPPPPAAATSAAPPSTPTDQPRVSVPRLVAATLWQAVLAAPFLGAAGFALDHLPPVRVGVDGS